MPLVPLRAGGGEGSKCAQQQQMWVRLLQCLKSFTPPPCYEPAREQRALGRYCSSGPGAPTLLDTTEGRKQLHLSIPYQNYWQDQIIKEVKRQGEITRSQKKKKERRKGCTHEDLIKLSPVANQIRNNPKIIHPKSHCVVAGLLQRGVTSHGGGDPGAKPGDVRGNTNTHHPGWTPSHGAGGTASFRNDLDFQHHRKR